MFSFTHQVKTFIAPFLGYTSRYSEEPVQVQEKSFHLIRDDGTSEVLDQLVIRNATGHLMVIATKPSEQEHYHIIKGRLFDRTQKPIIDMLVAERAVDLIDDAVSEDHITVRVPSMGEMKDRHIEEVRHRFLSDMPNF